MPLNPKFIRAIYATARETHCSNEELHEAIWTGFQKKSVKDLTTGEALRLLDGLKGKRQAPWMGDPGRCHAMGNHGRKDYDGRRDPNYLVTQEEMDGLHYQASLRGWSEETLSAFIARQLRRPGAAIRTVADFNKVFWPLKAMNRRDGIIDTRDDCAIQTRRTA